MAEDSSQTRANVSSNQQTLKEYGRGIIGGLLFSLPLIYTMEVWWTGFTASASYLLSCVVVTYLLLLGYNRYAGMRKDASFSEVCWDSVEEIGLALIVTFLFLLLISRIGFGMSVDEIAGKVVIVSMIVAIGISVGTAQLGQNNKHDSGMQGDREGVRDDFLHILVLALCGAVLFASSVAPTEEIVMIGIESEAIHILFMLLFSLLLSFVILFFSDFRGTESGKTAFKKMLFDVVIGYMAALLVSFGFLWFFGRVSGYSFSIVLSQMIVLSIPGSIGASAGRLLIK